MYLGCWQLRRADEKNHMLDQASSLAKQAPVLWQAGDKNPLQYQSLLVKGHYLPLVLLHDNQHYQHQFGYHVLSPFELSDNRVVLIDRGWVVGSRDRLKLPSVTIPHHVSQLIGHAYYPSDKIWVLGQEIEKKSENLMVIERINTQIISQFLHKSVYPFIIRLNKGNSDAYVREWDIVSMPPVRHKAYAFQWFAMAFALFVILIALNLKKINEKSES